jgi:AcrR family transcriptional regulator
MSEKEVSQITISELTAEADVNRRTFYTHYRNITDILDEVENELVAALKELSEGFDARDCERSTYNLFMGFNELISVKFDYYFRLIQVDMRGTLMSRLKNVLRLSSKALLENVSVKNSPEAALITAFITGGFFNTYLDWYINSTDIPIEYAAQVASRMVNLCVSNAEKVLTK